MANLDEIKSVVIHPAIGIARVGNSPSEYFFGPEIPGPHPVDPGNFRDPQGRIKRQAARFRLFGLNAASEVIKEITANDGEISWTVHVANKKAAWYRFDQALDIPASKGQVPGVPAIASARRNAGYTGVYRKQLAIDPGPRTISGRNVNADGSLPQHAFASGKFFTKTVYLGELRTDAQGHLVILGGWGLAASRAGEALVGFANNNGWHDDTADGPVDAVVRIGGQELRATGAWIIVGPPNYAPGVPAIVTGYDLAFEVATKLDPRLKPVRPSFFKHIYPLLERFSLNQWVNVGFAREFGWGSPDDFRRPELIAQLNNPGDASRPLRQAIFGRFRNPAAKTLQPDSWPEFYGDAVTFNPNTRNPQEWMAILELQYAWLAQWAAGDFVADASAPLKTWEQMSPAERASGLDRVALEETTGGPFHPGCEFTWPLRQPILYAAPFRIKRRAKAEPDWGVQLTSSIALKVGGPLDGSAAGDITRWMAVPWQADTASCLSAYQPYAGDYLPTFWPARVPNDVMTQENYRILMDPNRTPAEKEAAFSLAVRKKWLRNIVYTDTTPPSMIRSPEPKATFVKQWDKLAIVARQPGPAQTPRYPAELWVETKGVPGAVQDMAPEVAVAIQPPVEPVVEETPVWEQSPISLR